MNKAEIINGINTVIEGLTTISAALSAETADTPAPKTKKSEKNTETTAAPASGGSTYSRDELNKMGYNAFKTLAAKLGVKCTGTRDQIMERIEKLGLISDAETESADETESTTAAPASKGKLGKKNTAPAADESDEDDTPPKSDKPVGGKRGLVKKTADPAPDEFDEQAKAIADDTPVEEIISALADVGVKATKKNAVTMLADALRKGLIEADDDDESDEADAEEEDTPAADTESADEGEDDTNYTPEYDPSGLNDPENMTDARHEAVAALVDDILTKFSEGKLTADKMVKFLESNCAQEELDLLEDPDDEDALVNFYIEVKKRFVDDEGETHKSEEPYELNGKDVCCGRVLKHNKKSGKYICEVCGAEYEAE